MESLEERALLYAVTAVAWPTTDLTYSVVPDETRWIGWNTDETPSVWHQAVSQVSDTETWQRDVATAFQTWANHSNLNFRRVDDDGLPFWQDTGENGDIRLGASNAGAADGWASTPLGGGDLTLRSTSTAFNPDYFSKTRFVRLLTHEIGHTLGMLHSEAAGSTMGGGGAPSIGLDDDDVAGIQSLYGAREQDSWDNASRNDTSATASRINWDDDATFDARADLTSHQDVDFYQIAVPSGGPSLSITIDARQTSLLAPKVQVFGENGDLLAESQGDYGTFASVNLDGLVEGEVLTIAVDGATSDVFAMGAYQLEIVATPGTSNSNLTQPDIEATEETAILVDTVNEQTIPPVETATPVEPSIPVVPEKVLDVVSQSEETVRETPIQLPVIPPTTDTSETIEHHFEPESDLTKSDLTNSTPIAQPADVKEATVADVEEKTVVEMTPEVTPEVTPVVTPVANANILNETDTPPRPPVAMPALRGIRRLLLARSTAKVTAVRVIPVNAPVAHSPKLVLPIREPIAAPATQLLVVESAPAKPIAADPPRINPIATESNPALADREPKVLTEGIEDTTDAATMPEPISNGPGAMADSPVHRNAPVQRVEPRSLKSPVQESPSIETSDLLSTPTTASSTSTQSDDPPRERTIRARRRPAWGMRRFMMASSAAANQVDEALRWNGESAANSLLDPAVSLADETLSLIANRGGLTQ